MTVTYGGRSYWLLETKNQINREFMQYCEYYPDHYVFGPPSRTVTTSNESQRPGALIEATSDSPDEGAGDYRDTCGCNHFIPGV